ncbi:hypothetical protein [Magnetovibrio sp.]|uniref:hypothetical protein n=1 Tax=Magnetovibrio sp. TaxID=2024836 RepID=UPI002F944E98
MGVGVRKISKIHKYGFAIVGFVCLAAGVIKFISTPNSNDDGPIYSEERLRYIALEFTPKYEVADCTVSFDLQLRKGGVSFVGPLEDSFQRYVSSHEPKVGIMMITHLGTRKYGEARKNRLSAPYELVLGDQCNRKDQIYEGMVEYTLDRYGDLFGIERVPIEKSELNYGRFWLDSSDYNPDHWPTFHKAMRGDGEAFLALAKSVEPDDFRQKRLMYALAEHYLPNGPLQETARKGKEAAFKEMFPSQQKRADEVVRHWIQNIQKYNAQ